MPDPIDRLRAANPVPDAHTALESVEETRLAAMVRASMQRSRWFRVRGPAVAVAAGLAMSAAFVWVLIVGLEEPSVDSVATLAPPATTTVSPVPTTTVVVSTTVPPVVITWNRILIPGDGTAEMKSVAALGDGYVAVGWADTEGGGDAAVWLSDDGETWQRVPDDGSMFGGDGVQNSMSVAVDGDRILMAGLSELPESLWAPLVWFSPDRGSTWERIGLGGYGQVWAVTGYRDGFVAAGDGIWISGDGRDWARAADDAGADNVIGLAASEERIVAVGSPGDEIQSAVWTSTDGDSWERVPHDDDLFGQPRDGWAPPTSWQNVMNAVTWTGDEFVAVGFAISLRIGVGSNPPVDPAAWISEDGLAWTLIPPEQLFKGGDAETLTSAESEGGVLVAVGDRSRDDGGVPLALLSTDGGRTWVRAVNQGGGFDGGLTEAARPNDVLVQGSQIVMVGWADGSAAVWVGEIGG